MTCLQAGHGHRVMRVEPGPEAGPFRISSMSSSRSVASGLLSSAISSFSDLTLRALRGPSICFTPRPEAADGECPEGAGECPDAGTLLYDDAGECPEALDLAAIPREKAFDSKPPILPNPFFDFATEATCDVAGEWPDALELAAVPRDAAFGSKPPTLFILVFRLAFAAALSSAAGISPSSASMCSRFTWNQRPIQPFVPVLLNTCETPSSVSTNTQTPYEHAIAMSSIALSHARFFPASLRYSVYTTMHGTSPCCGHILSQ